MSEILKGWRDDDAPRTSSTSGAAGGAHFNASGGGRGRLGSGGTSRNGRGSGASDFGTRSYWRVSGRGGSIAGWSSNAGTERPGGGGGAKASIVSTLERAMSRSIYGGGGGNGRTAEGATPQPHREKNRSEELFGALMGQGQGDRGVGKGQGGNGEWGHGGVDGSGGGVGRKGEDGKNGEVDLGFLHRCDRLRVNETRFMYGCFCR